jgi:PREDICTED: similar to flocculin
MKPHARKLARTLGISAVIALSVAGCSNPENRPDPQPADSAADSAADSTADAAATEADSAASDSAASATSSDSASASESTGKSSEKSSGKSTGKSSGKSTDKSSEKSGSQKSSSEKSSKSSGKSSSSKSSSSKEPTPAADLGYGETIEPTITDGFYRIALPDGSLCELPETVAPGEDGLRCLLNIDKPLKDVNGDMTRGIVFRNGMFTPDEQLSTTEAAEAFMERNDSAEELKGAQATAFAGYSVVAESADEIAFVGATDDGFGTFFIAGQAVSPFWNPTPAWIEAPTIAEYLQRIIAADEKAGRR